MNTTDSAGYAGLALLGYHYHGILGAGVVLTIASLVTAIIVASGE